jgi:hypothetical protein
MKSQASHYFRFRVISLLLFGYMVFPKSALPIVQTIKNIDHFGKIWQKIETKGNIRVIIQMDIPSINQLRARSTAFDGINMTASAEAEMYRADAALQEAIDSASIRIQAELQGTDYEFKAAYKSLPYLALSVTTKALSVLQDSALILDIEEDIGFKLIRPDSPIANSDKVNKFKLSASDVLSQDIYANWIGAKKAWANGYTGAGWYIAILDTGIRSTHQFFSGKSIVEACFSSGFSASSPAGDCPNGQSTMTGSGAAAHFPSNYANYDHGTHISGIATGNYGDLAGVAKNANIIAVQVFSRFPASECGYKTNTPCPVSWESDMLRGLDYIYSIRGTYPIASVNMSIEAGSFSTPCDSSSLKAAIDNLRSVGIATIIETGNGYNCGKIAFPSCISTSIALGASKEADNEMLLSNRQANMQSLYAPGNAINSSRAFSNSSYGQWTGTDMATAHVAGAWALIKSMLPAGSVANILNALKSSGVPIGSVCDGYATSTPRIQIDRAIAALSNSALTVQSSAHGTTDPVPDSYYFMSGAQFQIMAVPNTYSEFMNWSGAGSGNANPFTVTVAGSKTISANFQYIYAPATSGRRMINRTVSQAEYVDILTWQANPANQGLEIAKYRVYQIDQTTRTLLAEISTDQSEYFRRKVGRAVLKYEIVAVTAGGREGEPAVVTIQ